MVRWAGVVPLPGRRKRLRALEAAGMAGCAALAGGAIWAWLPRLWTGAQLPARVAAAAAAYLVVWLGLLLAEQKIRHPAQDLRPRVALPLLTDLAGWIAGAGLALAG